MVEAGNAVQALDPIAEVESVKTTSQIYSPVNGKVSEFNTKLQDNPSALNEEGEGAWLWKYSQVEENAELLSEAEYKKFLEEAEHH